MQVISNSEIIGYLGEDPKRRALGLSSRLIYRVHHGTLQCFIDDSWHDRTAVGHFITEMNSTEAKNYLEDNPRRRLFDRDGELTSAVDGTLRRWNFEPYRIADDATDDDDTLRNRVKEQRDALAALASKLIICRDANHDAVSTIEAATVLLYGSGRFREVTSSYVMYQTDGFIRLRRPGIAYGDPLTLFTHDSRRWVPCD